MVNTRRYAHKKCADNQSGEQKEKIALEQYLMKLFEMEYVAPRIQTQIKKFMKENNFTYSGIKKALIYFHEVRGNPVDKKAPSIGIVPWIYDEAKSYYYDLWMAQQINKDVEIEQYVPKVVEITIPVPRPKARKSRKFSFLDEEVENE